MNRKAYRTVWALLGVLSLLVGGVSGVGSGLNQSVCLSVGMILGLALLPPEMLIELIETRVLNRDRDRDRRSNPTEE